MNPICSARAGKVHPVSLPSVTRWLNDSVCCQAHVLYTSPRGSLWTLPPTHRGLSSWPLPRQHTLQDLLKREWGSRLWLESWQTAVCLYRERDAWWPFSNVRPEEASCILISTWCRASPWGMKNPTPLLSLVMWVTIPYWHPCLSLPPFRCILRWLGWVCEKSLETFPNFIFSSGIHTHP